MLATHFDTVVVYQWQRPISQKVSVQQGYFFEQNKLTKESKKCNIVAGVQLSLAERNTIIFLPIEEGKKSKKMWKTVAAAIEICPSSW